MRHVFLAVLPLIGFGFLLAGIIFMFTGATSSSVETSISRNNTQSERGQLITAQEYGDDWPLSVDSGYLYCDGPGSNVVIKSGSSIYALNGKAMGVAKERNYVIARDSIFLTDENGFYTVGDVTSIVERGLEMCD